MPKIKVAVIGAGSIFALHTISDLIRYPELAGSTVALVDLNEEALNQAKATAQRMIRHAGADLNVEASVERRDVLPGCDFVLNSISVGEPWARERDVEIGERYGIYQPTSQTVGPAGFMRGLRVIPHAAAIAGDIGDLCPEAVVLDLANPLAAVCLAMWGEADLNVVGLCEQWRSTMGVFSEVLEIPQSEMRCLSAGTNHLTWALELYHGGQDVMPEFLGRLYGEDGARFREKVPVSCEIFEAFGLWPTGSENHIAEFYNYFLTPETHGGADYGLSIRHTSQSDWDTRLRQRAGWADGSLPIDDLLRPSGESAVEIIATILGIREPGTYVVNVPNGGLIDGLPEDAVVEVPAYVSPFGVQGMQVGALPDAITHTLHTRFVQQELLVEAALTGDRQLALQGLLLDAQITSLKDAREILEASIEANAEWLPVFEGE